MNAHHNELLPEDFAGDSRVWIYQSPRLFFLSEALQIEELLEAFVRDWKSHGTPVKGYANQEKTVLTQVIEARAKATQTTVNLPADVLTNPQAFQQFEQSQAQLSGSLGRLLAVSENYPDLKSNQNFLILQSQLEGTENRIAVARKDYIDAVQTYNTTLRTIPSRWIAAIFYPDAKPKQTFTISEQAQQAPHVQF